MEQTIEQFWQAYQSTLPEDHPHRSRPVPQAWAFGDSPALADELLALVLAGGKTGTCSNLAAYEWDNEPVPQPGDLSIILDGQNRPACILETTAIKIRKFEEVDPEFAATEGEGDLSLEYWRDAHMRFFGREYARRGLVFDPAVEPLICENFKLIYRAV